MRKTYKIEVDCANCAAKIEDAVKNLQDVEDCRVNFMTQKMTVSAPDDKITALFKTIEKTGKNVDSDFEIYK